MRILVVWCLSVFSAFALPQKPGDLDEDGIPTVLDLARLIAHGNGSQPLSAQLALFADLNHDGVVNDGDQQELINEILQTRTPEALPIATVRFTSPSSGEGDVAVTRETILHFTIPLSLGATLDTNQLFAEFGGRKILSRVEISSDRKKATLFYLEPIPSSARVHVTFAPAGLTDLLGRPFDSDGDGVAGGVFATSFDTITITPLAATAVVGRVFASERATGGAETPLAGVTITVDGAEETLRAVTDAQGNFTLNPAPAGSFFVHIDGRTSPLSSYPNGDYYPSVGKKWFAVAGKTDNPAGDIDDSPTGGTGIIYLPCICDGSLKPVSQTQDTTVVFPPTVLAANPALAGTQLLIPANSLFSDDGTRGGQVGIAPVAPDRLPSPLPPGLNPAIVITIQTDGGTNFDRPVPIRFPNLPDPMTNVKLAPGEKSALWSFNHDLGEWEIQGPMTVTDDGNFVATDAGVGVRQPGWHAPQPGSQGNGRVVDCGAVGDAFSDVGLAYANTASSIALGTSEALELVAETPLTNFLGGIGIGLDLADCVSGGDPSDPFLVRATPCVGLGIGVAALFITTGPVGVALIAGGLALAATDIYVNYVDLKVVAIDAQIAMENCVRARGLNAQQEQQALSTIRAAHTDFVTHADTAAAELLLQRPGYEKLLEVADDMRALADRIDQNKNHPSLGLTEDELRRFVEQSADVGEAMRGYRDRVQLPTAIRRSLEAADAFKARTDGVVFGPGGDPARSPQPVSGEVFMLIETNGFQLRLRTTIAGGYNRVLRPNAFHQISIYDRRGRIGGSFFQAPPNGGRRDIPTVLLGADRGTDTDNDGISDRAEDIVGTDKILRDTDGDGLTDGSEVQLGGDPLEGLAVATGVVASSDTPGYATDIAALNDLVAVADSAAGVALFSSANPLAPVRLAQIDTPGIAGSVAIDGRFVIVADGAAGVALIDAAGPRSGPQVVFGVDVNAVAASAGLGYAGLVNGKVVVLDLETGTELSRVEAATGPVQDLAVSHDVLYVITPGKLHAIPLGAPTLAVAASLNLPGGGGPGGRRNRLFLADTLAYATYSSGFNIVSLANPLAPTLVRQATDAQFTWRHIVSNGSGYGLAAATGNGLDDCQLIDLRPGGTGSAFVTNLPTPGLAEAVAIHNGLAFVADGNAGLTVVNYLAYDNRRLPPTIQLVTPFPPNPPTVEEGKAVTVSATVTDDVQVRAVDFYIDGQRVVTDGGFPFEYRFVTPQKTATKTTFTLRVRATDTGGNATFTPEMTVRLSDDATPPYVRKVIPANGGFAGGVRTLTATFNEPIDPATLTPAGFALLGAGPDNTFGTADDVPVAGGERVWHDTSLTAFLLFTDPLPPGLYRITLAPPVADLAGNQLAASFSTVFRAIGSRDDDGDGLPDDLEPLLGLDPLVADTDGDGQLDGQEDFDNDGLNNSGEVLLGLNPTVRDTDGNGIFDGLEDPDFDGLTNAQEVGAGTNALEADSDGDGWDDRSELADGTDPRDYRSGPVIVRTSRLVAFLNAAPEPLASGTGWQLASLEASYLNATRPRPPPGEKWSIQSLLASYVNGAPVRPDSGETWSVLSPTASYVNSAPLRPLSGETWLTESPAVSYLSSFILTPTGIFPIVSPIVSYRKTPP